MSAHEHRDRPRTPRRSPWRWFAALSFACAAAAPQPATAQSLGERAVNVCLFPLLWPVQRSEACMYDSDCDQGQMCRIGMCRSDPNASASSPQEPAEPDPFRALEPPGEVDDRSAAEACGGDRRCRIERLKRRNRARRYTGMLREEQIARQTQERLEERERAKKHRLVKPLAADLYLTFLGGGLGLSYTHQARWRFESTLTFMFDRYISEDVTVGAQTQYFEGSLRLRNFGFQAAYLLRDGWWSPYVGLGALYSRGSYEAYFFDDGFGFGGSDGAQTTVIMHVVQGSAGFDAQVGFGARARLGLLLRQPIYTQARYSRGNYDETTRALLEGWFQSNQRIGLEFSLGWAF